METTAIYLSEGLSVTGLLPEPLGKKEFIEVMNGLLFAVPNWTFNDVDPVEKGDVVNVKMHIRGRHTNKLDLPLLGIRQHEATWKELALPEELYHFTVKNNKVLAIKIDHARNGGVPGMLKQLEILLPEKVAV
jgi:hypothetical protein